MKSAEFQYICADYSRNANVIFELEEYDCVDTCLVWCEIGFYGIPFGLSDDQLDNVYAGNYQDGVKIGQLSGCLVLCSQILEEGHDVLDTCDAADGDLEYAISALSDEGGPLDIYQYQDVFYINELQMEQGYDNPQLKGKILDQLPKLVLSFLHVAPNILAFYPAPMKHALDPVEQGRYEALQKIATQKVDSFFVGATEETQGDKNVVRFGDAYQFTEDDLNLVTRIRVSGSSYTEEAKDQKELAFYMEKGFEEAGNSRLLYKHV